MMRMPPRLKPSDLRLYAITPDRGDLEQIAASAAAALAGGATALQLRSKHLSPQDQLALGRRLRELTRSCDALFLVNDRPDLARAVDADGVHLGQDDLPVALARRLLGDTAVIGASTETASE